MNTSITVVVIVVAFAGGVSAGWFLLPRARRRPRRLPHGTRRILLPFTGMSISRRSFDAAVRLARAEDATIMPAYMARVPRQLALDAPLPAQCLRAMPLLEAIEQRASTQGVAVDTRIIRGRTYRDALRRMLEKVPAEVLILRPDPEDHRALTAAAVQGHF